MAKKKKRTALPRVTIMAYSRRDLASFTEAVERLGLLVNDISAMVPHLRGVAGRKKAVAVTVPRAAVDRPVAVSRGGIGTDPSGDSGG
jgi:hypothetical protein